MLRKRSKILLTGGHLSPMLAVYEVLKKHADCVIVGRKYTFEKDKSLSLEYQVFSALRISFYNINAGRLQRRLSFRSVFSLFKTPSSIIYSLKIIKREKPDAVLTFGGYVGLPVALAAYIKGVPVVLHEQTQRAGITNKIIGKFAKKICISFPSSEKYFDSKKTVLTGNPTRNEIFLNKIKINLPKDLEVVLVMGGSTGSHNINEYIEFLLPRLLEKYVVIHQTGNAQEFKDFERLSRLKNSFKEKLKERYILKKFIPPSDIGSYYYSSDIIVSRAGVNTISELIALNKKAVLIPLSYGQKNEQLENAKYFEKSGLGTFMEDKNINLEVLYSEILKVLNRKVEMIKRNDRFSKASGEIAKITLSLAKNG